MKRFVVGIAAINMTLLGTGQSNADSQPAFTITPLIGPWTSF